MPLFAVAVAFAATFFGCAGVDGGGGADDDGEGDEYVFLGGVIVFVDELSNFLAISNESVSFLALAVGFATFFVEGVAGFLSSSAFDLPT